MRADDGKADGCGPPDPCWHYKNSGRRAGSLLAAPDLLIGAKSVTIDPKLPSDGAFIATNGP